MNPYVGALRCRGLSSKLAGVAACLVCLLVLPACRIPPLRPAEPGRELPAAFNLPATSIPPLAAAVGGLGVLAPQASAPIAETSAQTGVAEFFDDPTLTRLIGEALANNQELKIRAEDIRIAGNEILARIGSYLPFVSLGTSAGVDKSSRYTTQGAVERQLEYRRGRGFPDPLPNYLVAANVSWQVDIWRKLRNARDAATLRYLATAEGRNYVVTRLVAEIAENYYALLALDARLDTLDQTITLQEQSREASQLLMDAGRGNLLAVQRFEAEVRKNQSEKLIVRQEIIETENRINYLLGRYPQPVERASPKFVDLPVRTLGTGVPAQLLLNRPDIRQAERELQAAGLDVLVARADFLPALTITGRIGTEAFNPRFLLSPGAFVAGVGGDLVAPLINRAAIRAAYQTANARQLQSLYEYQRVVLLAFTEVVNRVSMVENYRESIDLKRRQLKALEGSVETATQLFLNPRPGGVGYVEVLLAQRDLLEARLVLIETKRQQLAAIVNAYQALGGGQIIQSTPPPVPPAPSR